MSTIRSIALFPVVYPEPHDNGRMRHLALSRVESFDGVVGWGEAITMFPEASRAVKEIAENGLAPLLLGQPVDEPRRLWSEMLQHCWWYGREGVAALAVSALDMALWDLYGKTCGQPLHRLAGGGALRREIPAMACIHLNMDDLDWSFREFTTFRDRGYRLVKGGWGRKPGLVLGENPERDKELATGIRAIIGPDRDFVLDILAARTRWDLPTAVRRIRELEPLRPLWIEEPLPPWDYEAHRQLRSRVGVAIGTGEQEWTPEGYRRLIQAGAADVVQIDPARCLGITGSLKILGMVEAAHLKFSCHTWSSALNTAVGVHLLSLFLNGVAMDFKPHESPMQHDLVTNPWEQREGMLAVRNEAGLGVTVRESVVAQFALPAN